MISKVKLAPLRQKQLREEAKGKECQIRAPGCNGWNETTVLCHLPGGGMSYKTDDLLAAWGCSDCHDLVDGRRRLQDFTKANCEMYHLGGVVRTQQSLLDLGYEIGMRED